MTNLEIRVNRREARMEVRRQAAALLRGSEPPDNAPPALTSLWDEEMQAVAERIERTAAEPPR